MRLSPVASSLFALLGMLILGSPAPARAEKERMLESQHYRVYYEQEHEETAGEILRLAEGAWPTLAKAYDAYGNYQTIDIFLVDAGDVANGEAIYPYSRVEIYLPHLNWVMRGRRNWLGNVVTHEVAHVFSLRQKARLWIFSDATVGGYTFNREVNWSLLLPWMPLVAPSWWVEGLAQFESEAADYDSWDSQRDMIVRDAWLTHTLPTLGEIETFDGNWMQAERTYNTGFAFLRYLRDRYGIDKVRALAFPKPFFHFGGAVEDVFGKSLPDLYAEWQASLAAKYADFADLPKDSAFDPDIVGSYAQNLAFSGDGKTMAWLGNGDRDYPLNWIYWKDADGSASGRSARSVTDPAAGEKPPAQARALPSDPLPEFFPVAGEHPVLRPRLLARPRLETLRTDREPAGRSEEFGSAGLEFSLDGSRLLTTRNGRYSPYSDLWEYAYRGRGSEEEKWRRLTWNERASDASYHPTRPNTIVFSRFEDGSSNVAVLDSAGRVRQLTRFREGQQVYTPRFTPAGDSIYFSLGIGGREAIAAIAADTPAWDPFAALEDSAAFPDSAYVAAGRRVRFVTPLGETSYRDLRFSGDTLLVSSNGRDGVYNVFARLPRDSVLYRLTRDRTQALEPQVRDGQLYYQGYEKQNFRLFREPARFEPAGVWTRASDSLPVSRAKKLEYDKAARSGEPGVKKVAWAISPYLNLSPQFLDDTTFNDLNVDMGLQVALGPVSGGLTQVFSGYVSKRLDVHTQMDYGVAYGGVWSGVTAWHQRFGWTPNLTYGVSHDVRHQTSSVAVADTLSDGTDPFQVRVHYEDRLTYDYDMAYGMMSLPLTGLRLGAGTLNTSWYARYWNQDVVYDEVGTEHDRNLTTLDEFNHPFSTRVLQTSLQRHLFQQVSVQWAASAAGTPLPEYIGVSAAVAQWWTRYAQDAVPVDSIPGGFAQALGENKPVPVYEYTKADFAPWQADFGAFGAWSHGDLFTLSFQHQLGFFMEKFPTVQDSVLVSPGQTVETSRLHPNLWVMPYRLWSNMPGYPYSFQYRGRDILEGTAMAWGRAEADVPLKIREYLDYPSPLSSLNKLQLSLIGDAGTVLDRTPDRLIGALQRGDHYLLLDYGARLSATFLFYHAIPMDLYVMAFMPYNQLKAENVYQGEWTAAGYASAKDYLRNVKEPRFFVGFTLGSL